MISSTLGRRLGEDMSRLNRKSSEDDLAHVELGAGVVDIDADEVAGFVIIENDAV